MATNQKKLLKQLQKDPKLFSLVKDMQNAHNVDETKTPKERLNEKLHALQGKRSSTYSKEVQKETKIQNQKEKELKKLEDDKFNAEELLKKQLNNARKNKNKKLKLLEKKYGNISEDKYIDTMTQLQDQNCTPENKAHYENLISLYNKQHENLVMSKLDDSEESSENSEDSSEESSKDS